jgi:hypothetical protein
VQRQAAQPSQLSGTSICNGHVPPGMAVLVDTNGKGSVRRGNGSTRRHPPPGDRHLLINALLGGYRLPGFVPSA